MNTETLVEEANLIPQPTAEAAKEYEEKRTVIVDQMNKYLRKREDLAEMIGGEKNIPMMEDNHNNHSKFMLSQFKNYQGDSLVKTFQWVLSAYPSHGFKLAYWPAQLNGWLTIMKENLSEPTFKQIEPLYDYLVTHQGLLYDSVLQKKNP